MREANQGMMAGLVGRGLPGGKERRRRPLLRVYIDTCQVCPLLPPPPPPPISARSPPHSPSTSRERRERKGVWGEKGEGADTRTRKPPTPKIPFSSNIAFIFATFGKPHLGPAPHIWRISSPPLPPPPARTDGTGESEGRSLSSSSSSSSSSSFRPERDATKRRAKKNQASFPPPLLLR